METHSVLLGIILGMVIGAAFAWLQLLAAQRREMLEKQQQVPTLLRQLPGSGARVAFLLMALILVQIFVPDANKWWLSGSLVVCSGVPALWRLRQISRS